LELGENTDIGGGALMRARGAFDEILDKVDEMPLEDQSMIIELIRNRHREKRREEILRNAQQTLEEYKKGLTSKGSLAELLQELEG